MWKEILSRIDRPIFVGLITWASWPYLKTPAAQVPFGLWFGIIIFACYFISDRRS